MGNSSLSSATKDKLKAKRAARFEADRPFCIFCEVKLDSAGSGVKPDQAEGSHPLEGLYVRGLQALGALGNFEFNSLAIVQRLIAISHDRGEMDENVLAALALDEAEALAGIEPLHCTLFFTHCFTLFCQPGYG
jgi:hypothetical protein